MAKVRLNEDEELVKTIKEGLKRKRSTAVSARNSAVR